MGGGEWGKPAAQCGGGLSKHYGSIERPQRSDPRGSAERNLRRVGYVIYALTVELKGVIASQIVSDRVCTPGWNWGVGPSTSLWFTTRKRQLLVAFGISQRTLRTRLLRQRIRREAGRIRPTLHGDTRQRRLRACCRGRFLRPSHGSARTDEKTAQRIRLVAILCVKIDAHR